MFTLADPVIPDEMFCVVSMQHVTNYTYLHISSSFPCINEKVHAITSKPQKG